MRVRDRGPSVFGFDLMHAVARLAVNTVAILVASKLIDGIRLDDWKGAVLAGAIFGIVNTFIKPVVKLLTCPLYLLTNSPTKRAGLEAYGLEVVERVPLLVEPNPHNERYYRTKREKMGHDLPFFGTPSTNGTTPGDGGRGRRRKVSA